MTTRSALIFILKMGMFELVISVPKCTVLRRTPSGSRDLVPVSGNKSAGIPVLGEKKNTPRPSEISATST